MNIEKEFFINFEKKHGRKVRVLHIGNIANNSYNNSKLLNDTGLVDCDVMCHDYYHIMGCPEWEDASFDANEIKDQFYPDWKSVNTNGFKRPEWFVQGPKVIAIKYLVAKRSGKKVSELLYWRTLNHFNKTKKFSRFFQVLAGLNLIFDKIKCSLLSDSFIVRFKSFYFTRVKNSFLRFLFYPLLVVISVFLFPLYLLFKIQRLISATTSPYEENAAEIKKEFADFPEISVYLEELPKWKNLLSKYDIVQGYATDIWIPVLANFKPCVAYEHGTIRDIPFENNVIGRLTNFSYRKASHVFITNPDCIIAAQNMCLKHFSYVPHVIDSKFKFVSKTQDNFKFFFAPARHDWDVKGNDIILQGFADFLKETKEDYYLVTTNWGSDLNKSKALAKVLGVSERIIFESPMGGKALSEKMQNSVGVIDQFKGYFGGIAPSALACGKPLVIYLEYDKYKWCFDSLPNHFPASCRETIKESLKKIVYNYNDSEASLNVEWVNRNYSWKTVVEEHLRVYSSLLSKEQ